MQRTCLAVLRFCLCAWVGVAIFFLAAVLDVAESIVYEPPPWSRFSRPTYFLPFYHGFAFALLGVALLCAFGSLWNAKLGLLRRSATLFLVTVALGMAAADYTTVYRNLAAVFGQEADGINPGRVVALYKTSRLLKSAVLIVSVMATSLVIWPESAVDLSPRNPDPAH